MPVAPADTLRSGTNKFMALAQTVCRFTRLFEPSIRASNSGRTHVIALLDAALVFCALLPEAFDDINADKMSDTAFDIADPEAIPGSRE